ncbi:MAG: response regulator transcription factor [Dehalococcoidia bacterium]
MPANKILVVEDEATLREMLQYNLEAEGYRVITAADGLKALELARTESPDLIVLDIMLPQIDGFEVCRRLRRDMTVPVLMLTAKEEEIDKVLGLELGADDYMTKPFSMRELKARIKAMLRRAEMAQPVEASDENLIQIGSLTIDIKKHSVLLGGAPLSLKPKEFDLLAFLARNRGHVYSRDALLERVWDYDYAGGTRTVDVHVRWLREKIENDPSRPQLLVTVRGIGYKMEG